MCRCGGSSSWAPTGASSPPPRRPAPDRVGLRYLGRATLLVKGAVSGRAYALRPGGRVDCDSRDVPAFLASPLFERWSADVGARG
jgi:hypothetical protein